MTGSQVRFDVAAVRRLAGDKVFARGEAYHRGGHVEILVNGRERVLAHVVGTELYRAELTGGGGAIGGACTCRAFEDSGFCKHMVATALAANATDAGEQADGDDPVSRIRAHLRTRDVEALIDLIVDAAERDAVLFRKLDFAASITTADDKALEAKLGKAIDWATRTGGYVDYRDAPDWAANINAVLDHVAELIPAGRTGIALRLAELAIDRVGAAIEQVDDSDGYCGSLLVRARDIHLAAARHVKPEPVKFARQLFDRELDDDWGTFEGASRIYADVLGAVGLEAYRDLAQAAWDELPSRPRKKRDGDDVGGHHRLMDILDVFAERDGDVELRIALRAKDLSSPGRYRALAEFCFAQGRASEALRHAEEGMWIFEDARTDDGLVMLTATLLAQAGKNGQAEALLLRAFEKTPDLALYSRLREIGGSGEPAIAIVRARLGKDGPPQRPYTVDLLIALLMHDRAFAAAWDVVKADGGSDYVRERLARQSEATHPREAIETYAVQVDRLANVGGDGPYRNAVALVAHMATLRGAEEQQAYVAALKTRFVRKRNFMALLG
jgi:tetratricopeptide (TPR) repeat protein